MFSIFLRIVSIFIVLIGIPIFHVKAQTATSILLFGDSIIAGYGLSKEDSLSVQLEQLLKADGYDVVIINGGVSGDTTNSGRSRLEWVLEKHTPDIVLLALGGNDVLRGFSPEITKHNLDAMLNILKEKNVQIIFSQVQAPLNLGVGYKKQFDAIYSELSNKYDLKLYPFLLKSTFGNNTLMQSDQIHPNADGVKVIANDLIRHLGALLKK